MRFRKSSPNCCELCATLRSVSSSKLERRAYCWPLWDWKAAAGVSGCRSKPTESCGTRCWAQEMEQSNRTAARRRQTHSEMYGRLYIRYSWWRSPRITLSTCINYFLEHSINLNQFLKRITQSLNGFYLWHSSWDSFVFASDILGIDLDMALISVLIRNSSVMWEQFNLCEFFRFRLGFLTCFEFKIVSDVAAHVSLSFAFVVAVDLLINPKPECSVARTKYI